MQENRSINSGSERPSTSYGAIDTGYVSRNPPDPSNDSINVRFRSASNRDVDGGVGETTPLVPGNSTTEQNSTCFGISDCCRVCWTGVCLNQLLHIINVCRECSLGESEKYNNYTC